MKCAFCDKEAIGLNGYDTGYLFLCINHWNMGDNEVDEKLITNLRVG